MTRAVQAVLVLLAVVFGMMGAAGSLDDASPATLSGSPGAVVAPSYLQRLERLPVAEPMEDDQLQDGDEYDRDEYQPGADWKDLDRDGCNTRQEVLLRDLRREVVQKPCKVVEGDFMDPYTRVRGRAIASVLDIDHVVSLGDALRSGGWSWTDAQKRTFAQDERNLLATAATLNRAKADQGPADWRPPTPPAHCSFARKIVQVKEMYDLSVTPADRKALRSMLGTCR